MNTCTKAALAVALTALAVISAAVIFTPDADDSYAYESSTVAVVVDENGTVIGEYTSFGDARDAAHDGQTVKFVKDPGISSLVLNKSITLDLGNFQLLGSSGFNSTLTIYAENARLINGIINSGFATYSIDVKSGCSLAIYSVSIYGQVENAGKLTLCDSTWNNKIDNTGGDLTLINSKIDVSGSIDMYIDGGKVTVYNSHIRIGSANSIFKNSESVTVYGGYCKSGDGGTFTDVGNVNIYGGSFYAVNGNIFAGSTSALNVHGGFFYGSNSDNTRLSGSIEGHETSVETVEASHEDRYRVFVMYDLHGCEECGKLDCTTGHFDNGNDLEYRDLLVRFASTDSVCASILAIDLHDLMPSIYAEGTYGYNLYSQYTTFYFLWNSGASYSSLLSSEATPVSYRWIVTEHTDSPDTPGSGTGTGDDDDDAGDLPPNVGPSASNSASGSSDSRTISIIAAAVVVIAMGVGALFVFRDH